MDEDTLSQATMYPKNTAQLYHTLTERAEKKETFADFDEQTITYRKLLHQIRKLTALFRERKVSSQDRILIISADEIQVSLLFLAALFDDLIPVVLAPDTKSVRAQAIVSRVQPVLIFVDHHYKKNWPWLNTNPCIDLTPSFTSGPKGSVQRLLNTFTREATTYFPGLMDHLKPQDPRCSAKLNETAGIIFSSGTTSVPKGIITTHKALFFHLSTISKVFGYSRSSIIFNNLALAHVDGLYQGPMLALYSGARLYRPQQFAIHNLEFLLDQLYSKKVTHFITVPTILSLMDRLLKASDYFEDEAFETIISVAGKLDQNVWSRIQNRFKVPVCNMYGLTETVTGGLFCGPAPETFRLGTVGKPVDMEAKIIDDKGEACPPGQEGELLLKGENVFPGYLDSPEESAASFAGSWLRTGDIAVMDRDGFYSIVGRKKAVIVSGGFNIHPDEVTDVLSNYPDVIEAATTGAPDHDWGELVMSAYSSAVPLAEEELMAHCRNHLEAYKVPKRIIFLPTLPRTISGKVKLKELQTLICEAIAGINNPASRIRGEDILHIAADVFKTPVNTLAMDLTPADTPGWDSLNHLNLIAAVEQQYAIQFNIQEMISVNSLHILLQLTREKVSPHGA